MDTEPISVTVVGFSDFERELLLTYLRHGGRHQLRYRTVASPEQAELLVVDGDQPNVVPVLARLGRLRDTVLVGGEPSDGAAAWLMRPLTPEQVLRALDEQRHLRQHPATSALPLPLGLPPSRPADLGWPTTLPSVADVPPGGGRRAHERRQDPAAPAAGRSTFTASALAKRLVDRTGGYPAARTADQPPDPSGNDTAKHLAGNAEARATAAPATRAGPPPGPPAALRLRGKPLVLPRALVVDDSEIALHFMRRQLRPYGLVVDVARFAHQALELMAQRAYGLVFLDVDLGDGSGEDGLKLCRRVRHQFLHPGPRTPMVVMVSAFDSPVDQVRGTLAGAEAYLGKPLDPQALDLLLRRLGFRAWPTPPVAGTDGLAPEAAPLAVAPEADRSLRAPGAGN